MGSWSQLAEKQADEMFSFLLVTLGLFLTAHCQVKLPDQSNTNTNTNTRLFSGNQALDSGTLGFGLGVGAAVLGSSLLNNNNNNPCGKRRRRSPQNSKDTRFFLGGNNNCNYPSNNYGSSSTNYHPSNNYGSSSNTHHPSNNYGSSSNTYHPSNNHGTSSNTHYPSNNYVSSSNSYPSNSISSSNNYNRCQCTLLSFTDHQGNVNGKCQSYDSGKGSWCYTTGWDSGCTDLHRSQKFPNNPWSYQACSYNRKGK